MTIMPVFSAAHTSRWENISEDEHRPRRKRTRTSDGESEADVDYRPSPRKVKPLPAHTHGHRQLHDVVPIPPTPAPEISTVTKKGVSHGQYIPTGRSRRRGGCNLKFKPSHIPPHTSRFYTNGGEDTYLDHPLVYPHCTCHFLGCGVLFHAVCLTSSVTLLQLTG